MKPEFGPTSLTVMYPFPAILAALGAGLLLAGCGGASPQSTIKAIAYGDPAKPYLGMSQAEIAACAGMPQARYDSGDTETLVYRYSGAGPRPAEEAKPEKKKSGIFGMGAAKSDKKWTCSASLVFEGGQLIRVSFAHREVESPYAHQSSSAKAKARKTGVEAVPGEAKTCSFVLPPSCGG
jgi:hypothetical protein